MVSAHLVLSLFPGIGLLDMAFELEGFTVVRGPDLLWGGDIRRFHPPAGRFDGIIGGPPCQAHSRLAGLVERNGLPKAECRIAEFERCISAARPAWFVMENVPDAPEPRVPGYDVQAELVRDHWCGGETMRLRRFSFGTPDAIRSPPRWRIETLALHRCDPEPAALASGSEWHSKDGRPAGTKSKTTVAGHLRKQGLPPDFFADSPFTVAAQVKMLGNGVPLAMGRAVAHAVRASMPEETAGTAVTPSGPGDRAMITQSEARRTSWRESL